MRQFRNEVDHETENETADTSRITISVSTKSGHEKYFMPDNFTGQVILNFNMGGLAGAEKKEKLK